VEYVYRKIHPGQNISWFHLREGKNTKKKMRKGKICERKEETGNKGRNGKEKERNEVENSKM
jgi:hypothetical protein